MMECSVGRKRKTFNLNRMFIAQMRRIFWFYYRPKCLRYHRKDWADSENHGGGHGYYWVCKSHHGVMSKEKDCQVDHIEPVKDVETTNQSWDVYRERLFIKPEQTQILCKPCHKKKTQEENARRKHA